MWASIEQLLQHIENQVQSLKRQIQTEEDCMADLKKQGLIYAGTWWKDGKYLYLVYPSDGFGSRKRQYIGAEQEKIDEANAGIGRGQKFNEAKARMLRLRDQLNTIQYHLLSAERVTSGDRQPVRPAAIGR